ncbi:MAG: preprotein translocase subunit SecA [Verrucomicrobiales bacterium]|jgi:preprotein translocase subunit SecA
MVKWLINKIVGSKNQRIIKRLQPIVNKINQFDEEFKLLSDEQLREKTAKWKEEISAIKDPQLQDNRLDEVLPEAFAVVKNASRRLCGETWDVCDQPISWEMVHFDVQLIGGVALHRGTIAEMATGEGKTLVATLPVFLNALTGRGVHLITVNDYLARRDSEWVGEVFRFLGLTVGCIQNQQPPPLRREMYNCDVTYGTNSEFGFDYLRDNGMAQDKASQVQRGHFFAIIDEVDSVLIDEARTPLIISGPTMVASTHQYERFRPLVDQLVKKQALICKEAAITANKAYEEGDLETAGREMFKLKLGQPKNPQLLAFMEAPEKRKIVEKTELGFYTDSQKKALFEIKEELFYNIDERAHDADLSEIGRKFLNPDDPEAFVLPDLATEFADLDSDSSLSEEEISQKKEELQTRLDSQGERIHNISQLLRAYCVYEKDVDYVVQNNKVVIVDENTGREMPGRRWSDGLHQAVEAKEGVKIDQETQTLATITVQNYFRLYEKLGGMTGTAETEAAEFSDIYALDVLPIPTNRPIARNDHNDHIFKTQREKYSAAIKMVKDSHVKGQPVLVGTASVESSEVFGRMLQREKIPHAILNAKFHGQEAEIVARAGQPGSVTVATNMAGRGTDIKLGDGVSEKGGLLVLGTERHESRRIDRQLRGRCARQGDPGETIFFISFEDHLMRNFGASDRMTKIMEKFGLEEGQELQHPLLNRSVETAQKRVEQRNYTMRKRVLEFDDVMNKHREVVYEMRNEVIDSEEPRKLIKQTILEAVPTKVSEHLLTFNNEEPDYSGLLNWANMTFPIGLTEESADFASRDIDGNSEFLIAKVMTAYEAKVSHEDPEHITSLERNILLNSIDNLWQEHLYNMDALREGVNLRSYGQKDPLIEYKNEAFTMFSVLIENIQNETLQNIFRHATSVSVFEKLFSQLQGGPKIHLGSAKNSGEGPANSPAAGGRGLRIPSVAEAAPEVAIARAKAAAEAEETKAKLTIPVRRDEPKVGRNDPCPCGSGKKFKQCCGRTS